MFPRLFSGEKFHEIELKEHVGKFSGKKNKKDVIAITINIDTNDSDSDIIIAEDEKHMSNNN